jgi:hypothetical protein
VLPEFKPVGGEGDGVMERKEATRWTPMLARFLKVNARLVPHDTTSTKMPLKATFDTKVLGRKWQAMKETYQKMKREHKVGLHISTGETGSGSRRAPHDCTSSY